MNSTFVISQSPKHSISVRKMCFSEMRTPDLSDFARL